MGNAQYILQVSLHNVFGFSSFLYYNNKTAIMDQFWEYIQGGPKNGYPVLFLG